MHVQAGVTSDLDETIKSILNRLNDVENENIVLKQQNAALNERLTQERDHRKRENDATNDRLMHEVEILTQKIDALEQENHSLSAEVQSMKNTPSTGKVAISDERNVTSSDPEPDTRSQFTAFACTSGMVTLSCPAGRTILTVTANYGQYDNPNSECTDCCAPNPEWDCTEVVEENRPSDWLAISSM